LFRRAAELGRTDGHARSHEVTAARVGLARSLAAQGRPDDARAVLRDELEVAEADQRPEIERAIRELEG
jgi:hypothetical protein